MPELFQKSIEMVDENAVQSNLTDAEKENYFKAFLSDQPYIHTTELFGGKLRIKFRTMSVQQNSDVVNQIAIDKSQDSSSTMQDSYLVTIAAYRMAQCLCEVDDIAVTFHSAGDVTEEEKANGVTYIKKQALPLLNWPGYKLSAFIDAFNEFEAKVLKLTNAVQDANFWKASA